VLVASRRLRGAFLFQLRQQPALDRCGGAFSFLLAKCEGAGPYDDRAQLGEVLAAVIEMDEATLPMRNRLAQGLVEKIFRVIGRNAVLEANEIESADEAAPAMSVIIAVTCPARTILAKILQQQVPHLHRLLSLPWALPAPRWGIPRARYHHS
jgi:hypothetical protein